MSETKNKKNTDFYTNHPNFQIICESIEDNSKIRLQCKNLIGSSSAILFSDIYKKKTKTFLFVFDDKETAAYFFNDMQKLNNEENIVFLPSSFKRAINKGFQNRIDNSGILLRTDVLNKINTKTNKLIIVSYPEALLESVITRKNLDSNTLVLKVGSNIPIDFIVEVLNEYQFHRVDFVYEPGQFAVRGSIVDIFSFSNDYPYRIDFFGDDVESIRTFDIKSQLSKAKLNEIAIIPNLQTKFPNEERTSFFEFILNDTILCFKDLRYFAEKIKSDFDNLKNCSIENEDDSFTLNLSQPENIIKKILEFKIIELTNQPFLNPNKVLEFNTTAQPVFQKNFKLLSDDLFEKTANNFVNYIYSENEKQFQRLTDIFKAGNPNRTIEFTPINNIIHEGFIDHSLKICCYTDHQIFERYQKFQLKDHSHIEGKEALTLKEINDLKPGDYVVHIDHGIGIFGGLVTQEINGKKQEAIRLVYDGKDVLFVSIHSLHRISKYKGKDGTPPKIHKLGSGVWNKIKQKTKSRLKDIARELIELYAKRKQEQGYRFSPDSYLQQELEASFIWEDTPDQIKATIAIKEDMQSAIPMDRLICGDVGFGKTEVAIRAAFKAVADSKQVAVLVPTTILAWQHYKTFSERLKNLPCKVDYLSRLKSAKETKQTLKELAEGQIDILIGTHRIVSQDVEFKDLGLLIIDEEQKFGVSLKEKLKQLKLNVDTLTLTATPIPRTLQFSLMGARDLSIINTPPPNRYPIITEVHTFNEDVIREAINYEITRNGQVFFIHNRIQNIEKIQDLVHRLCPGVKTVVAHGQMDGKKLEQIMLDFINEEYGVLISTTIIESGVDIPNVNTIIINDAQNFGLSDLHQLRGRVGRSSKKAFCYLLAPPLTMLNQETRRRLKAIETFSELGSGLNIALQDLDIRGAGNLLGAEQSGFIADIGFETYQRILDEALLELRETEYKELFTEENQEINLEKNQKFVTDCQIDTDMEVLLPENYIQNVAERIKLYRELDSINKEDDLQLFEKKLIDRFGEIPNQTKELFDIVRIRWYAVNYGIERIILKNDLMIWYFVSNQESPYYQSQTFNKVLLFVQHNPKLCQMKEGNQKLSLSFKNIKKITDVINIFKKLMF